uniref:Uncharacterized protein n=1 Tax=Euplotes crassus TaxID=5936 RepID=A0A7S3KN76_EUPCR|mmetsp:Transcript_36471/g.36073  ORF Transcript_36471/g.36073 Transcript_36471/m.36073 type:complete len:144 (+) Transcript_36471:23-454(+)|eukprot:CAMPEP_0197002276 /NCGR_PEP_ID=MMETSP1380-20130617/6802_1 /TAXON_ID=5936 /ORGANISM="Euplotes crassus, Strain CT5" /LENGTH=143 /DNA_ID=CAMNT_0042420327 /DNA_START=25 /DNA_END=456 /DNA_ORIENTATION=+
MEDSSIKKRFDSEQRDSEFFLWQSEDVDLDDPNESPTEKQMIYRFNSHPSLLVENKGKTKRGDFCCSNTTKNISMDSDIKFKSLFGSKTFKEKTMNNHELSLPPTHKMAKRRDNKFSKNSQDSKKESCAITQMSFFPKNIKST